MVSHLFQLLVISLRSVNVWKAVTKSFVSGPPALPLPPPQGLAQNKLEANGG